MCKYCRNNMNINSIATHIVNYKNCIILIKNVPCIECEYCGEKLETIIDKAKLLMEEIAVVDYSKVDL